MNHLAVDQRSDGVRTACCGGASLDFGALRGDVRMAGRKLLCAARCPSGERSWPRSVLEPDLCGVLAGIEAVNIRTGVLQSERHRHHSTRTPFPDRGTSISFVGAHFEWSQTNTKVRAFFQKNNAYGQLASGGACGGLSLGGHSRGFLGFLPPRPRGSFVWGP